MVLRDIAIGLALLHLACADRALILKPPAGKSGDNAAWILLPGAEIGYETYQPLAEAVQKAASMPLWVGVLGTYLTPTSVPGEIGPRIDALLKEMKAQGLDLDTVKLFYGGHSLGSIFIQDHLREHHGDNGPMGGKVKVMGQVLMGGFLQRKYLEPEFSYPVTTLTIGGELDGLARPTRLAESFYKSQGKADFPVAIIRGMTHMQFSSGAAPTLVHLRDLMPEISYNQAHEAIANLVAPYFESVASVGSGADSVLSSRLQDTADFVKPIIAAYELEGSRHFNAPAQIGGYDAKKCVQGGCPSQSNWAKQAQEIISKVDGWDLSVSNQYVDCKSTPLTGEVFHLPHVTTDSASKKMSITTYSQGYWDDAQPSWFDWKEIFDKFDTGYTATSAEEIGSKLASRQCTLINGTAQADTPFSVDDPDFCKMANEKAYKWALENAAVTTASRFQQYGQKFTFKGDIPKGGGPMFLDAHVQFNEVTSEGDKVIEVSSPMQKTSADYWKKTFHGLPRPSWIPDPGCFHYCKLLSPARVMEWIYVDSIRLHRGLSSPTNKNVFV